MRLTDRDIEKIAEAAIDMQKYYEAGKIYQSWQNIEIEVENGTVFLDCTMSMAEIPCSHRDPYLPDDSEDVIDSLTIDDIAMADADGECYDIELADIKAIDREIQKNI